MPLRASAASRLVVSRLQNGYEQIRKLTFVFIIGAVGLYLGCSKAPSPPPAPVESVVKESAVSVIPDSPDKIVPLAIGSAIPRVRLLRMDLSELDLASEPGPLLLIFYRGGWCPYCNRHLQAIQTIEKELKDLGYGIYGITPDHPEMLINTIETLKTNYVLLSDRGMETSKAFGLAYRVDDETYLRYKNYEIDLEKHAGDTHHLLPVPAAYLIGADGVVKFQYVNPDYKTRIEPDVLLDEAKKALGIETETTK